MFIVFGTLLYLMLEDIIDWWVLIVVAFLYIAFLYLCVTKIQWNYYLKSYNRGDTKEKKIALTFDDGPNKETSAILDILRDLDVPAAFFCIGENVNEQPELVRRMDREGHIVGNHSHHHSYTFDMKRSKAMLKELQKCNSSIQLIINKSPNFFRPPYGVTNPNLSRAFYRSGMLSIGWSLRSYDTVIKSRKKLKARLLKRLKNGDIIMLHDSMTITREILTDMIGAARQKGFTFVRLDQLLKVDAYQ